MDTAAPAAADATPNLSLVATDMDGTFLTPCIDATGHANGFIGPRSVAIAKALTADGVIFAIATGRPAPALQPHVDDLGIALPCICFNGAAVLKMAPHCPPEVWHLSPLEDATVKAVLQFADSHDLCCSYSLFDRAVARCVGAEQQTLLDEYMQLEGVRQAEVGTTSELATLGEPPLKIVLLTKSPDELAAAARAEVGAGAHIIAAEMHIEFLHPSVHKGTALAWLCDHLHVDLASCATFGDNHNDIEMLRAAGVGCAMSNAKPEVKAAADVVLEWSNADEGVARMCEQWHVAGCLRPPPPGPAV